MASMSDKVKQYYRNRLLHNEPDNFLWQVGKTVKGKEVSTDQVGLIVGTIIDRLNIDKEDRVLDVGCANGLLTKEISAVASEITGIELTPELCEIANKYNSGHNIIYLNANVLDYEFSDTEKFNKVYLYEVIQHLGYRQADLLIQRLVEVTSDDAKILVGGVLDIEKQWHFYDTEDRRCEYLNGLISGDEPLGTWFHKDFFSCLARKHGFLAEIFSQHSDLYTNHYRFDCVLQKAR